MDGAVETSFEALSFEKGNINFGIDMLDLEEIVKVDCGEINKIPASPKQLMGVINLRGRVVPIVNVSSLFFQTVLEPLPGDEVTVLIVNFDGELVGMLADKLGSVVYSGELKPAEGCEHFLSYTKGVINDDGRNIYLLDIAKLLDENLEAEML